MIHLKNSIKSSVGLEMCKIIRNSIYVNDPFQNSSTQHHNNQSQYSSNLVKEYLRKTSVTLRSTNLQERRYLNNLFQLTYQFSEAKQQKNAKKILSSHLSTLLSEPKQYHYLHGLFETFSKDSQKLNQTFQENLNFIETQNFIKILASLNTLSQNINLFLLQLQIQQISEIDKWKWGGEPWTGKQKQYRQNILIEIEERKVFYKRLESFISNITKQLQALFHSPILNKKNLSDKKDKLQKKNDSRLVQGDFFKHNFLTENYTEIYDEVIKSKQDYLLRSRKLKSFSLLKVNDYESNYALKLRLIINVMSQIKNIYQLFLINQTKKLTPEEICLNFSPLNEFIEQTVISVSQYGDLMKAYFNQFSQQNIKNFMFMSVGYHSPEISQLSKELIDVKIRQTLFDYDIENLCGLYLIGQNELLYNNQRSCVEKVDVQDFQSLSNGDQGEFERNEKENKYSKLQQNKQFILKYAKTVLKELNKLKKESNQSQAYKDDSLGENQNPAQKDRISAFQEQKVSFNRLLPHIFFNITDLTRLQKMIQQDIIPLMINPLTAYEQLVSKKAKDLNDCTNQMRIPLIQQQFFQNFQKILRDIDSNMYFLNRFNEWNISMIIHLKNFLSLFYQTEKQHLLSEVSLLTSKKLNLSQTQTPFLLVFFRMINILYNIKNHINPIYIEDFIKSIDFMTEDFQRTIKVHLCKKSSLSFVQLLEIFDDVLIKLTNNQNDTIDKSMASLLRFRILATFLDTKIISYKEFFSLLINPKSITVSQMGQKNEYLKHNPIFSFLLRSDGLQKCLHIHSQFYAEQRETFFQSLEIIPFYKEFSSIIMSYQKKFNKLLSNLEHLAENETFSQNQKQIESKNKTNVKNKKQSENFQQLLEFYQKNDLIHRYELTDQQIYINWLDKTFKSGNLNLLQTQKKANPTREISSMPSLEDLSNSLILLRILSQNKTFLSSSISLSYFNYLKYLIREMNAFEKFQSSWNYPFFADFAIGKKRIKGKKLVNERLYIQTLGIFGIQGRGKFFKEDTSSKKNFMNFIDLDNGSNQFQFIPVQTPKFFYGLRTKDNSIIQLRIPIHKGTQLLNTVKQWLADKFDVVQKKRNNRFDPQKHK